MSRPARDQTERKTIPSYYNLFNQFSPQPRWFPLDAKRAAERKLSRLRRCRGEEASSAEINEAVATGKVDFNRVCQPPHFLNELGAS